mmetsp:Transcript_107716/g.347713  ORF Transcript_107716/g.347713 Transcript_107716/m.347713 type:complete len:232 (+) Transcript_107716:802-1497(+)
MGFSTKARSSSSWTLPPLSRTSLILPSLVSKREWAALKAHSESQGVVPRTHELSGWSSEPLTPRPSTTPSTRILNSSSLASYFRPRRCSLPSFTFLVPSMRPTPLTSQQSFPPLSTIIFQAPSGLPAPLVCVESGCLILPMITQFSCVVFTRAKSVKLPSLPLRSIWSSETAGTSPTVIFSVATWLMSGTSFSFAATVLKIVRERESLRRRKWRLAPAGGTTMAVMTICGA